MCLQPRVNLRSCSTSLYAARPVRSVSMQISIMAQQLVSLIRCDHPQGERGACCLTIKVNNGSRKLTLRTFTSIQVDIHRFFEAFHDIYVCFLKSRRRGLLLSLLLYEAEVEIRHWRTTIGRSSHEQTTDRAWPHWSFTYQFVTAFYIPMMKLLRRPLMDEFGKVMWWKKKK